MYNTVNMTDRYTINTTREGFLADPMTMYSVDHIFSETFSMSMFHKLVFGEYNIDLDYIYDRCEESRTSFELTLRKVSNILYQNSTPFIKNKLIYRYFHELGLEIKSLVNKVSDYLREVQDVNLLEDIVNGERNTALVTTRIKALDRNTLDRYASENLTAEYMETTDFKLLRIIDDFLYNHLEIYNKIKNDLSETFNNTVKNVYRKRLNRSVLDMNNFLSDRKINKRSTISISSTITTVSTPTGNSIYFNNINSTYGITTGTSTLTNNAYTLIDENMNNYSTLYNDTWDNLDNNINNPQEWYRNNIVLKPKIVAKVTKKTPGVRVMNKSLKIIRKFFPARDLEDFLKCIEISIPGTLFNYGFKLRNRHDLISYSKNMSNFSISWDLNIYTKHDEKIARSCITFKNSPILDQVLSVYLMIKSNNEKEILLNSGFFDKEYPHFSNIIEPLVKKLKEEKEEKKENSFLEFRGNHENNGNIDTTLDGSGRYQNMRRNRYLEQVLQQSEIKTSISNWIRDYLFSNGFDRTLYEYTTNLDVSWGEAIDYEAFNLFNINCFDYLVKPLNWKKDLFRYSNRVLLEFDQKEEVIRRFTPPSTRQLNLNNFI